MPKTTKRLKNYVDTFEAYDNPYNLTKEQFKQIVYAFNTLVANSMVMEGKVYTLPAGVGNIGIYKKVTGKYGYFDFDYFRKTGEKRVVRNKHSAGFFAQVK